MWSTLITTQQAGIYPRTSFGFAIYRTSSLAPIYWRFALRAYCPCANLLAFRVLSVKHEKMAKHLLEEVQEVSEVPNTLPNVKDMVLSQDGYFLLYYVAAALSYSLISLQTTRGRGCTSALCLHFRFCISFPALSSLLLSQFFAL